METGSQGDALQSLCLWDKSPNTGGDLEAAAEAAFCAAACAASPALEQGMGLMPLSGLASGAVSLFHLWRRKKRKHIPVQKLSITWGLTALCRAMGAPTMGPKKKE